MFGGGAEPCAGDGAHDERHGDLSAVDVAEFGGVVEQLVEGGADEVDVHDLGDGAEPGDGCADGSADEPGLGEGGVDDPLASEAWQQSFGDAEGAAPGVGGVGIDVVASGAAGDVLAEQDDAWVGIHLLAECFVDGVFDRQFA